MRKKVIIFDMDGVLFDSIGFAREHFLKTHPGVTRDMYDELHSGNYHKEAAKYRHLKTETTEEQKAEQRDLYAKIKSEVPLFDGILALLTELHDSGNTLGLNTNAYNRNCLPLLEKSGIKSLFDFIATADRSKDKVEKFSLILARYRTDATNAIFVTDTLGDLRDADDAGVPTVAVTYGVHKKEYFIRESHKNLIAIVDSVADLARTLKEHSRAALSLPSHPPETMG